MGCDSKLKSELHQILSFPTLEGEIEQVHKRLSNNDVKALPCAYCQGAIRSADLQAALGIGKTRLFALPQQYRCAPDSFSVAYSRAARPRLSAAVEAKIEQELLRE